ncbi:MAG TPA: DUF2585 family protein [Pyrinomonadaceae bacterium]|nr:DUF2585 family protein [Pyrinomonadaceae bacterium]
MGSLLKKKASCPGTLHFWAGDTCSSNNSQQFLDPYSFTHVLHGIVYFWLIALLVHLVRPRLRSAWQLWLAVTVASLWELFENSTFVIQRYREATAALGYQGDTVVNSMGDILCCAAGFMIARRLGLRRSVLAFVGTEIVLLLGIRDSLLLEILMLVHPVGAIKIWQLCH